MTTVTVPTDYATIQEACNVVTIGATENNPGIVYILNGEYRELGSYDLGLYIRNYVNLIGESRDGVIIKQPAGISNAYAVFYPGYCATHENLTLYATNETNNYALHQDHYSPYMTWKNCKFYHENPARSAIGGGGRGNQIVIFQDCIITQGIASVHGDVYSRAVSNDPWRWELINCSFPSFLISDFIEYKRNVVLLRNTTLDSLSYGKNLTYYNLYPNDPLFNQGTPSAGIFVENATGNTIGSFTGYSLENFLYWNSTNNNEIGIKIRVGI